MLDFDRSVADDLQQRLVVPDVIFTGRDVQITDQNGAVGAFPVEMIPHFGQEIQFLAEFHILLAVGDIAACGDIAIVDRDAVFQPRGNVAGMAKLGEILVASIHHWQLGQDRDAVIALLPACHHVTVAKRLKLFQRDQFHRAFAFLQAQDIGAFLGHQPGNQPFAQADRIDVPGGKGKGHGGLLCGKP
jgi:hypothetical protein